MKYNLEDIIERYKGGEKLSFLFFCGHKTKERHITECCLSQRWPAEFFIDGVTYNCVEQYIVASKARMFPGNEKLLELILKEVNPKSYDRYERMIKNCDDKAWREIRYQIAYQGNLAKFSQNEAEREFLLNTGEKVLVYANPYDILWGNGMKSDETGIEYPETWKGLNSLGFLLMSIRDRMRHVGTVCLDYQDFYDISDCLNKCLKGSYSQREVACKAYEYYKSYKQDVVNHTIVELAKKLDTAVHTDCDNENCLWWLYCLAKGLKLINLSLDEYTDLEDRVQCFVVGIYGKVM